MHVFDLVTRNKGRTCRGGLRDKGSLPKLSGLGSMVLRRKRKLTLLFPKFHHGTGFLKRHPSEVPRALLLPPDPDECRCQFVNFANINASVFNLHRHCFTCHKGQAGKTGCRLNMPRTKHARTSYIQILPKGKLEDYDEHHDENGNDERHDATGEILAMGREYGSPTCMMTFAMDGANNANVIRLSLRGADDVDFPSLAPETALERLKEGRLIYEGDVDCRYAGLAKLANENPAAVALEYKKLVMNVMTTLVGISPEDMTTKSFHQGWSSRDKVVGSARAFVGVLDTQVRVRLAFHPHFQVAPSNPLPRPLQNFNRNLCFPSLSIVTRRSHGPAHRLGKNSTFTSSYGEASLRSSWIALPPSPSCSKPSGGRSRARTGFSRR